MSCVSSPMKSNDASTRAASKNAPTSVRIDAAINVVSSGKSLSVARRCEKLRATSAFVRDHKQRSQNQIDDSRTKHLRAQSPRHIQGNRRNPEGDLLDDGHGHERPITNRIARNHDEDDLPGDRDADEAVEVLRMRNRRREVAAGFLLEKILRQEDDESVDGRAEKDALRKGHCNTRLTTSR